MGAAACMRLEETHMAFLTEIQINGLALWAVALVCVGVFLASFMDAIAGGGGIISVPTYLLAFSGLPTYFALGTNKLSACMGAMVSTGRFVKNRCVNWPLALPSIAFALLGSMGGTWLQHHTPDFVLKYLLLIVLPVVALITLRTRTWPDEPGEIAFQKQALIVWSSALVIGAYDGYYGPGCGTLLMLVSAIYDREHVMEAYQTAVREKYRFFSFGDAMLIV